MRGSLSVKRVGRNRPAERCFKPHGRPTPGGLPATQYRQWFTPEGVNTGSQTGFVKGPMRSRNSESCLPPKWVSFSKCSW